MNNNNDILTSERFPQILNREEIDFFLNKKHTENHWSTLLSPASVLATNSVFIEILQKIVDTYAQKLNKIIRKKISGKIISIGQSETNDFFSSQTEAFKLSFDANESAIACILPIQSAHILTAAALGNRQTSALATKVEQRIIQLCTKPLAESVCEAFADLHKISAKILPINNQQQSPKAFIDAVFVLDIDNTEIKLILTFPHEIRRLFNHSGKNYSTTKSNPQPDFILSQIAEEPLDITAVTPATECSLQEVCQWQKGSFIPLSIAPDDDIFLSAENMPLLTGTIGRKGRRIAIKTTTKVTKNDKF